MKKMLHALDENDQRISASKATKGVKYFCPNPNCPNKELILKKGKIRIPHFAHKSNQDCSFEPESETHLACKLHFQTMLGLEDEFVEYYGIEGVRPDVLYGKYALEIQCSLISKGEIRRRNAVYKKNGYTPVWIFLEEKFLPLKKNKEEEQYFRIKNAILGHGHRDIHANHLMLFTFTYKDRKIQVFHCGYFGYSFYKEYQKVSETLILTKQVFDAILEEVATQVEISKQLKKLKNRLDELPKTIQGLMYELSRIDQVEINERHFLDGMNDYCISMFLDQIFRRKGLSFEVFNKYIQELIVEARIKEIEIRRQNEQTEREFEDWRNKNTFHFNGKIFVPVCRLSKISHETLRATQVYGKEWIPKSVSYRDERYIYCEQWFYEKNIRVQAE